LREANLKLQPEKTGEFLQKEVTYFGHMINGNGVHPNQKKIEVIKNFPSKLKRI